MRNTEKMDYSASDLRAVSDNPKWTTKEFAKARPFAETLPGLAVSIRKRRGPNEPCGTVPSRNLISRPATARKRRAPP
jgi:hypothetical protein